MLYEPPAVPSDVITELGDDEPPELTEEGILPPPQAPKLQAISK